MAGLILRERNTKQPTSGNISLSGYNAYDTDALRFVKDVATAINPILAFKPVIVNSGLAQGVKVTVNSNKFIQPQVISGSATFSNDFVTMEASAVIADDRYYFGNVLVEMIYSSTDGQDIPIIELRAANGAKFVLDLSDSVLKSNSDIIADLVNELTGDGLSILLFYDWNTSTVKVIIGGDVVATREVAWKGTSTTGKFSNNTTTITKNIKDSDTFKSTSLSDDEISGLVIIRAVGGATTGVNAQKTFTTRLYNVITGDALVKLSDKTVSALQNSNIVANLSTSVSGGVGNKTFSLTKGKVPKGTSINADGTITGTAAQDGTFNSLVVVSDAIGNSVEIELTFVISAYVDLSYSPPSATVGEPFSFTPPPVSNLTSWAIAGNVPAGFSFNTGTGKLSSSNPSASGSFPLSVTANISGQTAETIDFLFVVYDALETNYKKNGTSAPLTNGMILPVSVGDNFAILPNGGSGQYNYSSSNQNYINQNGQVTFTQSGDTTVTIIDAETGQSIVVTLEVYGQKSTRSVGVIDEVEDVSTEPNADIITESGKTVEIAFDAVSVITNFPNGVKEPASYDEVVNAVIERNGKPFAMFTSNAPNALARVRRTTGANSYQSVVVSPSMINAVGRAGIGFANANKDSLDTFMSYAAVVTTVENAKVVQFEQNGTYVAGSQYPIAEGMSFGLLVVGQTLTMFVNDNPEFTFTFAETISNNALFLFAENANVRIGGRIPNLSFSIETTGEPYQVGTIDSQTGRYTPSDQNVARVAILGTHEITDNVSYLANVQIIRPAEIVSLERALLQGTPVKLWLADRPRADDKPPRFGSKGQPDANQFLNPFYAGRLQGAATVATTENRQAFTDDAGETGSSHRIDKIIISGGYLQIWDFNKTSKFVPYMEHTVVNGVQVLTQRASGCLKKRRLLIVFERPDCEGTKIYDCIEFDKVVSYTLFGGDFGQSAQTQLPLNIEAYNDDSVDRIFRAFSYTANMVEI